MQIVIDIDEKQYNTIKNDLYKTFPTEMKKWGLEAIRNGIPLDKITAEIWEEAEWAYSNFDEYKEIVLEAEPDELPDDEFRFGLHRAVEIINKYKAENEVHCNCTNEEIAKSFIEDVEAVKDLLPKTESEEEK